jgi:hypothetical protein
MKSLNSSTIFNNSLISLTTIENSAQINTEIMSAYLQLREEDLQRRSHFFGNRYENLYLKQGQIPALEQVIALAEIFARQILQTQQRLRSGFWINDMGPGQETSEHDHDEFDELLSGVYYVQVPKNSGELIILDKHIHTRTVVTPQAGMMAFFAPTVLHAVSANLSQERRISIGMNFGPIN